MNSQNIMFVILAVLMVLSSIATVLTKSIVRAATYLFFVLLGTAGMYFLMGYTFLGAAQVIVYAGGIIVLYVFSILLTEGAKDQEIFKRKIKDASWGFVLSLVGFLTFAWVVLSHNFKAAILTAPSETVVLPPSNQLVATCSHQAKMVTSSPSRQSVYSCSLALLAHC